MSTNDLIMIIGARLYPFLKNKIIEWNPFKKLEYDYPFIEGFHFLSNMSVKKFAVYGFFYLDSI